MAQTSGADIEALRSVIAGDVQPYRGRRPDAGWRSRLADQPIRTRLRQSVGRVGGNRRRRAPARGRGRASGPLLGVRCRIGGPSGMPRYGGCPTQESRQHDRLPERAAGTVRARGAPVPTRRRADHRWLRHRVAEHFPRKRAPMSFVPIVARGGAFADVGADDTAFGGARAARYAFNIAAGRDAGAARHRPSMGAVVLGGAGSVRHRARRLREFHDRLRAGPGPGRLRADQVRPTRGRQVGVRPGQKARSSSWELIVRIAR